MGPSPLDHKAEMRGNASVAFNMQALLSAARPLAVARSVTAPAMAILKCIAPPDISRTNTRMSASPPESGNLADFASAPAQEAEQHYSISSAAHAKTELGVCQALGRKGTGLHYER
jgi:hypothetical protein